MEFRFLEGNDYDVAKKFMLKAAELASNSSCFRSKCGSVVVKDDAIIGTGFNSPPKNECLKECFKDSIPKNFKSDRTCCIHAEQRAIMEAVQSGKIEGSRLYFIRTDSEGNLLKAGKPYCTICSKMALDFGVKEFALWHEEGICVYDTTYYNKISFEYRV